MKAFADFYRTDAEYDQYAKDVMQWQLRMRMGSHVSLNYGHAFADWWDKYSKTHPDYFALNKYGKRAPELRTDPKTDNPTFSARDRQFVKLCPSNPKVAEQIIQNWVASGGGKRYPWVNTCQNDMAYGFCRCPECLKLDARKDGEKIGECLTDRYVYLANAVVRHHDRAAIERALNAALERKRNLLIPAGRYRLDKGFVVPEGKSVWIEGESGEDAFLDISEGTGPVFSLLQSAEVTLRSMRLAGHTGMMEIPLNFRRANGELFWTMNLRPCQGVLTRGARRVWIENVHASRMALECFYSKSGGRKLQAERGGTQAITYLGCTVTDTIFNAFNNNDFAENTSLLYCRVDNASNFWEGASRFLRCVGNHVRNCHYCGTFGGIKHRFEHFNDFGAGQMIVAHNVFEGMDGAANPAYQPLGRGPTVDGPANEVIIRDNIFVNFSSGTALRIGGLSRGYPCGHVTVSGNMIDLTHEGGRAVNARTGILIAAPDVVVSDNQIYVRGEADPDVTGILVDGSVVHVTVHDNIIRNCACGIVTARAGSRLTAVLGADRFLAAGGMDRDSIGASGMDMDWPHSHRYRGWFLHWLTGAHSGKVSEFDSFDAGTLAFKLKEPLRMAAGDEFAFFPRQADWFIHHNIVADCANPVILNSYGSDTSLFADNLISRGLANGVKEAVTLKGNFAVIRNRIAGFNDPESAAIAVYPDPLKQLWDQNCRDNVLAGCGRGIVIFW